MTHRPTHIHPPRQSGAALLLSLLLTLSVVLAVFFRPGLEAPSDRPARAHAALVEARNALIGEAAARANDGTLGLLQLPDLGSSRNAMPEEGRSAGAFTGNAQNLSVLGRLPWRTLGLRPLRDAHGECLWYAISAPGKNTLLPPQLNWDTVGHFELFASNGTAAGTQTANADPHSRPLALVIAPGAPLAGQNRAVGVDLVGECGGNYDAANYLDTAAPDPRVNNIVNFFPAPATNHATGDASVAPKPIVSGNVDAIVNNTPSPLVNDLVLPITAKDIFDIAKQRQDFKNDLNALLEALANGYLNALPPASLPVASAGGKGFDAVYTACDTANCNIESNVRQWALLNQWRDNFLYAGGPAGNYTVNGKTGCKAVLIFAGERTAMQQRASAAQRADPAMYLEGANAGQFPANGVYEGASEYSAAASSSDIVRCIDGAGAAQVSLAADFASFRATGGNGGVSVSGPTASAGPSVSFASALGTTGGCFWSPVRVPLLGKTLRAFLQYRLAFPDTYALTNTSPDRGYGFTLNFVRGDLVDFLGTPQAPTTCGLETNLGALPTTDLWGSLSYIVETDIYRSAGRNDPSANHIGILANGSLTHPATPTAACDGTSTGCAFTPANVQEESPSPLAHNQRIEIHTGCTNTCNQCIPSAAGTPGYTRARISVWVDCLACADVSRDFVGGEQIVTLANRDLSVPGDWQGTGWSFQPGALTYTAGGNPATLPNSALTLPAAPGKSYRLQLGLRTDQSGTLTVRFGGNSAPLALSSGSGQFILDLDATGSGALSLLPGATWQGALTSASISTANLPSARRCLSLPSAMNTVFFGLTGGFTSAPAEQGVTIGTLYLRSD